VGAVVDRSIITLESCLRHAKYNAPSETFELELMLQAIKEQAEYICQNNFVLEDSAGEPILDDDGTEQPQAIPIVVELWIMRKFTRLLEYRIAGANDVNVSDLGSIRLEESDWKELLPVIKFGTAST
jgi:hypothetical protein